MTDRELDALVAEKVMGWPNDSESPSLYAISPKYSTSIEAAWEVVEKICATTGPDGDYYDCIIDHNINRTVVMFGEMAEYRTQAEANTAPRAICLAALKAVGVEK